MGPYFHNALSRRIHKKLATNVVLTGQAGIGKTYMAIDICRVLEGKTDSGKDRFSVDQIVFTYNEFMDLVLKLKAGKCIIFDEPSYAMGKREWYKDLNKALTQTIESFRFKLHPLFIPIINKSLLDKTIRDYLIQYQVNVYDRGKAIVYTLKPSQFLDKTYYETFCQLYIRMLDKTLCKESSCLGCDKIMTCQVFRAQYERKKASVQESRYEQARDGAFQKEAQEITEDQMIKLIAPHLKEILNHRGRVDVNKLRKLLKDLHSIHISPYKAYNLKGVLETEYAKEIDK